MGPLPAWPGARAQVHLLARSITAPTLVITSDNDQLIPVELSELIAARIFNANLVVIPGAGHIPFMEQPDKVVRVVLDFIGGVTRAEVARA
jgi:pimeloyl-ACP methyl ester carboxylesterase